MVSRLVVIKGCRRTSSLAGSTAGLLFAAVSVFASRRPSPYAGCPRLVRGLRTGRSQAQKESRLISSAVTADGRSALAA